MGIDLNIGNIRNECDKILAAYNQLQGDKDTEAKNLIQQIQTLQQQNKDLQQQLDADKTNQGQSSKAEQELALLKKNPLIPFSALDIDDFNQFKWTQQGKSGNTGGGDKTAQVKYSINRDPSGVSSWSFTPNNTPKGYSTSLWTLNVCPSVQATTRYFLMESKVGVNDQASFNNFMAFEYNLEDRNQKASQRVNFGLQGLFGKDKDIDGKMIGSTWRWWDYTFNNFNGSWIDTKTPINIKDWAPGKMHYVGLLCAYSPESKIQNTLAIFIDNNIIKLNNSRMTKPNDWLDMNAQQVGFQIDSVTMNSPITLVTSGMNLYWR
jgi:hypothetical protein